MQEELWTAAIALLVANAVLIAVRWAQTRATPDVAPALLKRQSDVATTREPGESAVYRSHVTPLACDAPLIARPAADAETLYDLFHGGLRRAGADAPFLGGRSNDGPYLFATFGETLKSVERLGTQLVRRCKLTPGAGTPAVGIFMRNTRPWALLDLACAHYSLVSVPLYDQLGADALVHMVDLTELPVIAVLAKNARLVHEHLGRMTSLQTVILCDDRAAAAESTASDLEWPARVKVMHIDEMCVADDSSVLPHVPPKPTDLASVCFSTGPDAQPLGVELTHGNFCAAVAGFLASLPPSLRLGPRDTHVSYLSLAHTFERTLFHALTFRGASIGFYRGNILSLMDDIQTLQPTVVPIIPLLLNRLVEKVRAGVASLSFAHRAAFSAAFSAKEAQLRSGVLALGTLYDRVAFSRIQAKLGGRLRLIISGTAAIDNAALHYCRVVLGCHVLNAYGRTEAASAATMTLPGDYQPETGAAAAGPPLPCVELKLRDRPELLHAAADKPNPRGEICLRGPALFRAYYKRPAETAAAFLPGGWFCTGDLGEILPHGAVRWVGRVADVARFSQSEYLAAFGGTPSSFAAGGAWDALPLADQPRDPRPTSPRNEPPAGEASKQRPAPTAVCRSPSRLSKAKIHE